MVRSLPARATHSRACLRPGRARAQPSFFEPLRRTFRLHFAEDFGAELSRITNNYALYAVETLLFFGSQASVESLSFQSGERAHRDDARARHATAHTTSHARTAFDTVSHAQVGLSTRASLAPACAPSPVKS